MPSRQGCVHLLWFKMCRRWQHGSVLFRPAPVATGAAEGRAGRVRRPRAEDCHRRAQFRCIGACRPNYKAEQDTCPCLSVASTGFITTTPSEGLATFLFPPPLFLCRHGDIHSPPREGGVCGILSECCCGLFCSLGGTAAHAPDHKQSIYTQIGPGQRVLSPPIFFWSQIFFVVGE